jgi:hypothetical protein
VATARGDRGGGRGGIQRRSEEDYNEIGGDRSNYQTISSARRVGGRERDLEHTGASKGGGGRRSRSISPILSSSERIVVTSSRDSGRSSIGLSSIVSELPIVPPEQAYDLNKDLLQRSGSSSSRVDGEGRRVVVTGKTRKENPSSIVNNGNWSEVVVEEKIYRSSSKKREANIDDDDENKTSGGGGGQEEEDERRRGGADVVERVRQQEERSTTRGMIMIKNKQKEEEGSIGAETLFSNDDAQDTSLEIF